MTSVTDTRTNSAVPTAAELLDRAIALRPWLREHQADADRQGRVPQETIDRLDEAGVFTLTKPKRFALTTLLTFSGIIRTSIEAKGVLGLTLPTVA